MSAIAALYNVPGTSPELNAWSFAHIAHHRDINRLIYQLFRIALPEYSLDPFNPANTGTWADLHQEMHQNQNRILQIAGYDLLNIDWKDQGEVSGWIFLNATEHKQASDILGIG